MGGVCDMYAVCVVYRRSVFTSNVRACLGLRTCMCMCLRICACVGCVCVSLCVCVRQRMCECVCAMYSIVRRHAGGVVVSVV